jgi:hypothetical protein
MRISQRAKMQLLSAALVLVACVAPVSGAPGTKPQVFIGGISDTQCAFNVHSNTSSHEEMIKSNIMGNTPEECVRACVKRGGLYAFVDTVNKTIYHLDDQSAASKFAGKKVQIRGVYDKQANQLHIQEITAR